MQINENYLGGFSRDALKILLYMIKKHPKKLVFTDDELGKIIGMQGRGLGGVLGAFSQKSQLSLIIKFGKIMHSWSGEKFSKPKQTWAINPKLTKEQIKEIREILDNFLLEV